MRFCIRVGDTVQIARGNRNRNPDMVEKRRGRVLRVDRSRDRLIIEAHNVRVKHLRKSQQHPNGGRLDIEAPIAISNVLVVTTDGDAIPVRKAIRTEDGKVVARAAEAAHTK